NSIGFLSHFQKLNDSWNEVLVPSTAGSDTLSTTLKGLRSGDTYEVRVLVIDTGGKFREIGALISKFRTLCGEPKSPPKNVKIDNSSAGSISISWQNPTRDSWLCWSVNVSLEVNGTIVSFNLTQPSIVPNDRFVMPTRPFTQVSVRLRLDTPDGTSSQWTEQWIVTSAEDGT
ncbi:unnamed protein product, partial [Ixodes hexagonus]